MTFEEQEAIEQFKAALQEAIEKQKMTAAWELEEQKFRRSWEIEEHRRQTAAGVAMNSASVAYASAALRGLMLVNGGAVLAILTFAGNMRRLDQPTAAAAFGAAIAQSVEAFIWGLAAALIALGVSYLSQIAFVEPQRPRLRAWLGNGLRLVAILAATASLGGFVRGALSAVNALQMALVS